MNRAPTKGTFWLAIATAIVIRSAAMVAQFDSLGDDPDGYRSIAHLLCETGDFQRPSDVPINGEFLFPTAYRPPLYPLLLAAVGGSSVPSMVVAVLHVVIGTLTAGLTYQLAKQWLGDTLKINASNADPWAAAAAILVALDPILLRQASLVMTETLATFLAVATLLALTWFSQRPHWSRAALAGVMVGLACLCRPTFLPWMACATLAIFPWGRFGTCHEKTGGLQSPPTCWFAFIAACTVTLLPWTIRNYFEFGQPIVATTHGGYTLLLANNPEFYAFLKEKHPGHMFDAEGSTMGAEYRRVMLENPGDELAADRWANDLARKHIAEAPQDFAYAAVIRAGRFWQLMPHRTGSESTKRFFVRLAIGIWYSVVFLGAIAGFIAVRGRIFQPPWLWGMLLVATLTAVHAIYWSNMRMRAPVMPIVIALALVGIRSLKEWIAKNGSGKAHE